MLKKLLISLILVSSLACSPALQQVVQADVSLINANKNQLLFLSVEVTKTSTGLEFSITDQKKTEGKLKRPMPESSDIPDHFVFEFQNDQGANITQVAVVNPLTRNVEIANENGTFSRQDLDLDRASVILRVKYKTTMRSLKVSDPSGNILSTLPLVL